MSYVHTAHLVVKPECIVRFKARIRRHAEMCIGVESGCLDFQTFQDREDPTRFMMFEVYESKDADTLHRNTRHFKLLRQDIDEWVTGREWWFWEEFTET